MESSHNFNFYFENEKVTKIPEEMNLKILITFDLKTFSALEDIKFKKTKSLLEKFIS